MRTMRVAPRDISTLRSHGRSCSGSAAQLNGLCPLSDRLETAQPNFMECRIVRLYITYCLSECGVRVA
jgi:hypothetical protein